MIGRTLDEQLKVECLFGYALCGANPELVRRSEEFLAKTRQGARGRQRHVVVAAAIECAAARDTEEEVDHVAPLRDLEIFWTF